MLHCVAQLHSRDRCSCSLYEVTCPAGLDRNTGNSTLMPLTIAEHTRPALLVQQAVCCGLGRLVACLRLVAPISRIWSQENLLLRQLERQHNGVQLNWIDFDTQFGKDLFSVSISSRSHITTDGQSATSSWCQASFGAGDQILLLFDWQLLYLFFMYGALSDERTGL
jgi:hypothetical protein